MNHEEIENTNRLITSNKTESLIKNLPSKARSGLGGFIGEFDQIFKEELLPILLYSSKIIEEKGILSNSC